MSDKGSLTNPGVALRDIIRGQAARESRAMDQVSLGTVADVGDGATVEVLLDGFSAGVLEATWATPVEPAVDQRVAVLSLKGGQNFFVTGVLGGSVPVVVDHGALGGLGDDDHPQYVLVTDGINGLGDVTITTATEGDWLRWRTGEWMNEPALINGLDDVTITTATEGDLLRWRTDEWVNEAFPSLAYLPLVGGTMTGAITMDDLGFNTPQTGGTGQGTLSVTPSGADNGWYLYWAGGPNDGSRGRLDIFGNSGDFLDVSFDGQVFFSGTEALPGMAFVADEDTGLFLHSAGVIGFSTGGNIALRVQADRIIDGTLATGSAEITLGAVGTEASPTYTWYADADTGFFRLGSDVIGFTAGATERFRMSTAGFYNNTAGGAYLLSGAGDASTPSFAFVSDLDTGIFRVTTNMIGFTTAATERFRLSTTGFYTNATGGAFILSGAGGVSTPAFAFVGDEDTGIYRGGANVFAVAVGGVSELQLSNAQFIVPNVYNDSVAGTANILVESSGRIRRATSALKYKTNVVDAAWLADIDLRPVEFDAKYGDGHFYGFIADEIAGVLPDAGEYGPDGIENYDSRAVLAVLAAKVNRLEREMALT
jgi:hypothetical protein